MTLRGWLRILAGRLKMQISLPDELVGQLGCRGLEVYEVLSKIRLMAAKEKALEEEWAQMDEKRMTALREGFLLGCEVKDKEQVKNVVHLWSMWRNGGIRCVT